MLVAVQKPEKFASIIQKKIASVALVAVSNLVV